MEYHTDPLYPHHQHNLLSPLLFHDGIILLPMLTEAHENDIMGFKACVFLRSDSVMIVWQAVKH